MKSEGGKRTLCRVFLCHNSGDKSLVKEIADRLELDFGILHFLDAFDIPTGEAFRIWIERALKESTGCAIFLGSSGWGPTHIWEAQQALSRSLEDADFQLIPVALPGIRAEDMGKLGDGSIFRDLNWADFRDGPDNQDALDKLHAALTGEALSEGRGPARLTPYQVRRDAARWMKSLQRDSSILYRGSQLEQAEHLAGSIPDLTTKSEVAPFLLAGAHRQRSMLRRVAAVAISASLAIGGLAVLAEVLREESEQHRVLALSGELAMKSKAEQSPASSLLLAAQAYGEMITPETTGNLLERIQAWPHLVRLLYSDNGALARTAWASDSSVIAGSFHGHLLHWSLETFKVADEPLRASTGSIYSLAVDDEGQVWAGYEDGRVLIWDKTGRRTSIVGIPPGFNLDEIAQVNSLSLGPRISAIALSPDRKLAAVGTGDGTATGQVYLIDQKTKTLAGGPISIGVPRANSLAFDSHSSMLAVGTGFGSVALIDTRYRTVRELAGPKLSETLAVLIAGNRLVAVGDTGTVSIWARVGESFEFVDQFKADDGLTSAAIRPDGGSIALGHGNGQVNLYSVVSHALTTSFRAHTGPVYGIAWSPNGTRLASTGSDGDVGIWDIGQASPISQTKGRVAFNVLALAAGDNHLLVGRSSVGSAGIWQSEASGWTLRIDLLKATLAILGTERFAIPNAGPDKDGFEPVPSPEIEQIRIDRRATKAAWVTVDGSVLVGSLAGNFSPTLLYDGKKTGKAAAVNLSSSGKYVAVADAAHHALIFDLSRPPSSMPESIAVPDSIRSLNFNPLDTLLAVGFEDGSIGLWSISNGVMVTPPVKTHEEPAGNVTFSSDGSKLFSNAVVGDGNHSSITVSPVPLLHPSTTLVAQASGSPPAMIEVEDHIFATIDNDGKISFWDADALVPLGFLTISGLPLNAAAFDAQNGDLLVADEDGWIRSLSVGGAKWQSVACSVANREFSDEEWQEFLGPQPRENVCSGKDPLGVRTPLISLWHTVRSSTRYLQLRSNAATPSK